MEPDSIITRRKVFKVELKMNKVDLWLMRKMIDEKVDWWESWLMRKSIDKKTDWWESQLMRKLTDAWT